MDKILSKTIATGVIMLGSAGMILARRWKNSEKDAGMGVAGWTIFIILILWSN